VERRGRFDQARGLQPDEKFLNALRTSVAKDGALWSGRPTSDRFVPAKGMGDDFAVA